MKDLIDRRDAIDAVCKSECESGFCGVPCPEVDALKALTPAQPESAKRTAEAAQNVSDSDLISRKAAIDAIADRTNCGDEKTLRAYVTKHSLDTEWAGGVLEAIDAIEDLPPVQPERKRGKWIGGEIGRCSVCGHKGCASDIWNGCEGEFCPNCGEDLREDDHDNT